MAKSPRFWQILQWSLLFVWVVCAALDMRHVRAGLLTRYGADLTQPAWLYIVTRGLDDPRRRSWIRRFVGASPERAAVLILLGSTATELSQKYWPRGFFPGTFDPLDIAAFAFGVGICFALEVFGDAQPARV